jgi:hypothetical protein
VIGASLVLAAAVFAFVSDLLRTSGDEPAAVAIARLEREAGGLRRQVEDLRAELSELTNALEEVKRRQEQAAAAPPPDAAPAATEQPPPLPWPPVIAPETEPGSGSTGGGLDQFGGLAPQEETEGLTDAMQLAKARFNITVQRPRPQVLREILGEPRDAYSQDCQPVTNKRMITLLETRQVAGFKLTMIRPALDSLQAVMDRLKKEEPDIYSAIGTAGALCARFVRGSSRTVSSHAWAAAVDLTMKKKLDQMGDGSTQFGLVVLAEFFNDAGWYWGAGYGREDSMHFEVGEELLRKWVAEGRL